MPTNLLWLGGTCVDDWKDRLRQRQQLQGRFHAACDAVHQITGRTDQHYRDIIKLYPDHPAVKAFREVEEQMDKFDAPSS